MGMMFRSIDERLTEMMFRSTEELVAGTVNNIKFFNIGLGPLSEAFFLS